MTMWRVAVTGRKIALTPSIEPEIPASRKWHATPVRPINNLSTPRIAGRCGQSAGTAKGQGFGVGDVAFLGSQHRRAADSSAYRAVATDARIG